MVRRLTPEEQAERSRKLIDTGAFLYRLREHKGISLAKLGTIIGVSANYLSEVERGSKSPSDGLIKSLSEYYDIDEDILYVKLGRPPASAVEELEENETLQELLSEIKKNPKITKPQKTKLYEKFRNLYRELLKVMKKTSEK